MIPVSSPEDTVLAKLGFAGAVKRHNGSGQTSGACSVRVPTWIARTRAWVRKRLALRTCLARRSTKSGRRSEDLLRLERPVR